MHSKYSNIFWHQGANIFDDESSITKISHLENDVTKALLNVFQHGSKKILGNFLHLIDVKQAPETFDFDFQVTDTYKYRQKNGRIMLSIISAATQIKSDQNYRVDKSIPDACIFNKDTVILIEAKTQSPLISEQLESHIKHFLGSATVQRILTWEEISDSFSSFKIGEKGVDTLLLSQFTEFLNLIGLGEFKGFLSSDFARLGSISKSSYEEYYDFKRFLHRKIEKFMPLLNERIEPALKFKPYTYQVGKFNPKSPVIWSAFSFIDDDNTHINYYPNINFGFEERGIQLALNAETKPSIKRVISFIEKNPAVFENQAKQLSDFNFSLHYKYQYLPQNHFIWNFIPGYPKEMSNISAADILTTIKNFEDHWEDYKRTIFFQIKKGMVKHPSGEFFYEKEFECAQRFNKNPNYVIRISKSYTPLEVEQLKKNIVIYFEKEILKLLKLVEMVVK